MTMLPAGAKVHLAVGYIDMRKGMDGLAMLIQGCCTKTPSRATFLCSAAATKLISSRSFIGTAAGFACSPSGSIKVSSFGRRASNRARRSR